ncbi:MAG: glycosyltransferase family 4 protein [Actinobacteria bacterium]|nr:glycosyltransferase family 4 protein [Actinomycetota bacterium]
MKALLVDPSSHGGIAVYTSLIARALSAAGQDVTVLGSRALSKAEGPYALKRWLPQLEWGRPADAGPGFFVRRAFVWGMSAAAVETVALAGRADVVHFQAPLNRRLDASLIRAVRKLAPVVWTAHDVLPFERTAADSARFAAIYRAADLVLVHSAAAAGQVRELAGVEPLVVDHVVALPLVSLDPAAARERLGLPREGRILAALGFIRPYKGYDLLADVWGRLGDQAPYLLVMGQVVSGEDSAAPLAQLERTGRAEIRLGYASDEDLQLAIAAADAVLLPYTAASESGLMHQARSLGTPVVASDVPALAEAVEASSAGRVVPRNVDAWAAAVTGLLPESPPTPPTSAATAAAHVEAYDEARRRRRGP